MREVILKAKWVEFIDERTVAYRLVVPTTGLFGERPIAWVWKTPKGFIVSHLPKITYPTALAAMQAVESRIGATPAEPERED